MENSLKASKNANLLYEMIMAILITLDFTSDPMFVLGRYVEHLVRIDTPVTLASFSQYAMTRRGGRSSSLSIFERSDP